MSAAAPALLGAALAVAVASPASAATDEAWATFREEVRVACAALTGGEGAATVEVNPFGSESYGAALVTIVADGAAERHVCIFDKRSGAAELTAPFAAPDD